MLSLPFVRTWLYQAGTAGCAVLLHLLRSCCGNMLDVAEQAAQCAMADLGPVLYLLGDSILTPSTRVLAQAVHRPVLFTSQSYSWFADAGQSCTYRA